LRTRARAIKLGYTKDETTKGHIMSNTSTKFFGIFYIHPVTGKTCALGRNYTTKESAALACANRNEGWGNLHYFYKAV
jgi:hypothetical protein